MSVEPLTIQPFEVALLAAEQEEAHARIDALERRMLLHPETVLEGGHLNEHPLEHRFMPGLYVRQIFNPAGSLVTTKIHRLQHPFFVLRGRVSAYIPGGGTLEIQAPYHEITKPGTRRVIGVHEDTIWITVHATTPEEDAEPDIDRRLAMIEERIIERREIGDGRTAFEVYQELLAVAEGGHRFATELNPGREVPPIDYDGLAEQAELLAAGEAPALPAAVEQEAAVHMEELGLQIRSDA